MLFSGDTVCEWGISLHLTGECSMPPEFLASMERLKSIEGSFDAIWVLFTLSPAVGALASIPIFAKYKLRDKTVQIIPHRRLQDTRRRQ
jgi:Na+/melibiose symporter-like transporter